MKELIDKVALLPIKDRKVLFVRTPKSLLFINVGGKREGLETDIEVLVRECLEELGVRIIADTAEYLNTFEGTPLNNPNATVRIACYNAEYEGDPSPHSEVCELRWFSSKDGHLTTETGQKILAWLKERDLID